jgi:hypothetical protein
MGLPVGLIRFKDYLLQKIVPGSNNPPASIKAADLDKNFAMLCLQKNNDYGYDVQITDQGTSIAPSQQLNIITDASSDAEGLVVTTQSVKILGQLMGSSQTSLVSISGSSTDLTSIYSSIDSINSSIASITGSSTDLTSINSEISVLNSPYTMSQHKWTFIVNGSATDVWILSNM